MIRVLSALLLLTNVTAGIFGAEHSTTLNVHDFGAKGDGIADDTAAFQAAFDQAATSGGLTVFTPPARYMIRGHLNIPEYVTLEGSYKAPPATAKEKGTSLLAVESKGKEDGPPFITMNRCSVLKGLQIFYPEQKETDIAPYPWCVRGIGDNIAIRDVLMVNPYKAVDFGTNPAGRHLISGLYAQALKTGLFIDKCFDVGRVENVHFWPFWTEKAMDFTKEHGTAFVLARTDWEYMRDCFCISYKVGFHLTEFADGPGNPVMTQCGSDIGPIAVKVDCVQQHAGVSFSNGQFMAGIEVGPKNTGPVKFTSCGFWGVSKVTESHAVLAGTGTTTFDACHFIHWDQMQSGAPCIVSKSGGLTISGCEFIDAAPNTRHFRFENGCESVIVQGNRFRKKIMQDNASTGTIVIAANAEPRN